tara:strand:+ start:147 stop:350 length:204 start_codon:yes stop_codon:yes gene_type:complete
MPLIKNKAPQEKTNLRGKEISSEIFSQVEKYCAWAEIQDLGVFFEEAAIHIFKLDKEFKAYLKHEKT